MCRCQHFTTSFATESSMTSQSKTRKRRAFATVKVGSSNSSTNDFIRVSSNSSVTDVTKTLGSFVMFVLPAEIEERRHGESSESANMSRPNLFNVLMQNARDSSTSLPPLFPEGRHPQKAKLLNAIIKWLESIGVGWPPDTVKSLGLVFVNTLADAMWYIDQNHDTLVKRGHRVPDILCQFSGFRHPEQQKKRKIDSSFLKQDELKERFCIVQSGSCVLPPKGPMNKYTHCNPFTG